MSQTELQEEEVAENASNNRKWESNHNGSLSQQNKGHKVPRAHTAWPTNKKAYDGSLPLRNQCKSHHSGQCTVKCENYKKVVHIIQNCGTPATAKNQRTRTCYKCGSLRHYKSECPIVKFHKRVDMIHGRIRASKQKTMQDAIKISTKLRNKKISTLVECQTKNKKRLDNTSKNNQNQRQPNKRQNTGRACTARHGEKKHYGGSKPLCSKCNYHHDGPCAPKCHQCNRFGHLAHAIEIATKLMNKKISTLVECETENMKRLDNTSKNNQDQQLPNKRQNTGRAYTTRHGEKKHYSGSKPFFSKCYYHHDGPCAPKCHQCNRFGHLARDCRIFINANTSNIQKGTGASQKATCYECGNQEHYKRVCLGFDAIIGMDWLRRHHTMIVCDEKLISATREDDKPEGKQVKDVPIIQDFPKVFSENLPGLPPARPVIFQIDLIPGAALVARRPYRLAPSEIKELSEQLQELFDKGVIQNGKVAYKLKLPKELSKVHHTFHVSNVKKCYSDESLVMPLEGVHINGTLQFVGEPVEIMEQEIKQLKRSRIPLVKVCQYSRRGHEFTWEREDQFKQKYPHLFTNRASSSTTRS
nr:putative reverse transcriptase domain-containing protein [Tanacetum cinerariifolium]